MATVRYGVLDAIDRYGDGLVCPACAEAGNEERNNHVGTPLYVPGRDAYQAAPDMVRGDVYDIPVTCEAEGHIWFLRLGQHKGVTRVWAEWRGVVGAAPWA